jgi:uncharacterized membrane protein
MVFYQARREEDNRKYFREVLMFGLTTLGVIHTFIGLIALACGFRALARDRQILLNNRLGQAYLLTTLLTALTSLGIFQHGGFGPPHGLALLTLAALAVGTLAASSALFGAGSRYVQAVAYSATILFHLIPGFTETLTRFPPGAPLASSPEAPVFKLIYGILFVLFLIGLVFQLRWLRTQP